MVDYALEIIGDERLVELYDYWLEKRGRRRMPSREDIDPSEISALLPNLMLVDVMDDGDRFRIRLVGTALTDATGIDATGRYLPETMPAGPFADYVVGLYREAVTETCPIYAECEHGDPEHVQHTTLRLIMPLSGADDSVDAALVGQVYATRDVGAVVHRVDEEGAFEQGVRVLLT